MPRVAPEKIKFYAVLKIQFIPIEYNIEPTLLIFKTYVYIYILL